MTTGTCSSNSPSRLAPWEAKITGLPADTVGTRREEGTFVSPALHVQHYVIAAEDRPGNSNAVVPETIQRHLGEEIVPRRDPNVKADRAAVRARRIAMEMVDEETGRCTLSRMFATP